MSEGIDRWDREHRNFARLLDAFESQLSALRGNGDPDYDLMLDIMDYLTGYSDSVHHPREDVIFAKVAQCDPSAAQAVEELAGQHQKMADDGRLLRSRLQSIVNGAVESRDAIESGGREYVDTLRRHMEKEYREVFPVARKVLTAADWEQVDAERGALQADPLTEERLGQQYAALRRLIGAPGRR